MRVSSYLLRVQLADRPGSLGSLAVALGSVGADILSLDVVERGPGYAIDDLVVELPARAMPDTLITAAEALNGVRVDSLRPHTGLLDAHRELALIDHVAAAGDTAAKLKVLVDEAPQVLRVSWCAVLRKSDDGIPARRGQPRRAGNPTERRAVDADRARHRPGRYRRLGAAGVARAGHHPDRRAVGRPRHRGDARPAGWPGIPAVGGGPAGLPGRNRRRPCCIDSAGKRGIHQV